MGFYAAVPGRRIAYDDDGTVGVYYNLAIPATADITTAKKQELNDEDLTYVSTGLGDGINYTTLIFPELRDLDGVYAQNSPSNSNNHGSVYVSANTTNGVDGTWTLALTKPDWGAGDATGWREDIETIAETAKRALQIRAEETTWTGLAIFHVYGEIASGSTPDRILILDATTGLAYTADHDWGDVPRGTVHGEDLKLKNNSSTLTANTVVSTFEDLYLGSSAWYDIKEAGGAYASSLSIASIGAGVTYANTITVRKTVPDAETLGLHAARMQVAVTSWT